MRISSVRTGHHWLPALAGVLILVTGTAHAGDLGDILLKKGLITADELKQAQEEQKQKSAAEDARRDAIAAKIPKWLDAISLFGDVRVRDEGFYGNNLHARTRFRIRARPGLTANVSDEIAATVRLASGDPNDPISSNQTFSNTFTRKPINLDWAYVTLKPGKTFGLEPGWITVNAGKFGVNTYKLSELVWDDDVSPEGATESLNLWERRTGFLRGLRLSAVEWTLDELSADKDPWIGGGQAVADTAFGSAANWTLGFADYNYINTNKVASKFFNQYSNYTKALDANNLNASYNSQLAGENSNDVVKDANGKITGYKSGFNVINGTTELNFPDPVGLGIPAGIFGDVAYNTQADGRNVGFYAGAGFGNAGRDWYHDVLKNKGDWGVTYTYARVEKDAVLSILSYSDSVYGQNKATQGGSTNISTHILRFDYELFNNFQLTARAHFINALDRGIATTQNGKPLIGNPTLVRTQLDAVLKF
jgi:hypothetical protein